MKIRRFYATLCVPGALLPWVPLLPWFAREGFDVPHFFRSLFANGVSSAFAIDLILTLLVVCAFVLIEGRRVGVRNLWAPIVACFAIGVSLGLPLFLYQRQLRLDRDTSLGS